MPSQKSQKKSTRRRYSPEFKIEALGLAEQVGVAGAAQPFVVAYLSPKPSSIVT